MALATPVRKKDVVIRPCQGDEEFLFELYRSTRDDVLSFGWTELAIIDFLRFQFRARETSYMRAHPNGISEVIEVDGCLGGRLLVEHRPSEVSVIDVALLPRYRGNGIGSMLLATIIEDAAASGISVRLEVRRDNRARNLYARMGFVEREEAGSGLMAEAYLVMEKQAA